MSGVQQTVAPAATARAREYAVADRAACMAVFESNVPVSFLESERGLFAAFLDRLPGPYLVLEDEAGRIVACGGYAVTAGTTTADLCWGMVVRDRQGRGLGRALVEQRLALIRSDAAVTEVALETTQHTCVFYERLGFETVKVDPDAYAPGLDRCVMRLGVVADVTD